jgi:hypothetical protein
LKANSLVVSRSNPFLYLSLAGALLYNWSGWVQRRPFGVSIGSQLGIYATLLSVTLTSITLLGVPTTMRLLGLLQVFFEGYLRIFLLYCLGKISQIEKIYIVLNK